MQRNIVGARQKKIFELATKLTHVPYFRLDFSRKESQRQVASVVQVEEFF
ncbi:hypothetical protein [Microseira wollei]|nr:hypothetical protein [Microseira wollei]